MTVKGLVILNAMKNLLRDIILPASLIISWKYSVTILKILRCAQDDIEGIFILNAMKNLSN